MILNNMIQSKSKLSLINHRSIKRIPLNILPICSSKCQRFFIWLFATVKFTKILNFHVGYDLVLTQVRFPVKLHLIDLLYLICCYLTFIIASSQQRLHVFLLLVLFTFFIFFLSLYVLKN